MNDQEIDEWLGNELMEWTLTDAQYGSIPGRTRKAWVDKDGECQYLFEDWHPTSDIAQAFMCVEAMRERGYIFDLCIWPDSDLQYEGATKCRVFFAKTNKLEPHQGQDDNPALAIVLAIKSAIGGSSNDSVE